MKFILSHIAFTGCLILFFPQAAFAYTGYTVRVMTYNLWNYGGESDIDNDREDDLRLLISETDPDLLVVQEVENEMGYTRFLEDVLNHTEKDWEGASFKDQPNTDYDIALFFKSEDFEMISTDTVDITSNWGHRDAVEFMVKHSESNQEVILYGVHFKAGSGQDDAADRESEATKLRKYLDDLDSTSHFFVMGDFNVYDGEEEGFQKLVESLEDNDGRLFDPIDTIVPWHNNMDYAKIHTQATRASYNGWNYGGMDDRFDFILASKAVMDPSSVNIVADSYTAFGNDGTRCCNEAINAGNNSEVSSDVADALYFSSDHLPVYIDITFNAPDAALIKNILAPLPAAFELGQNFPNPFNATTIIPFSIYQESHTQLKIVNLSSQVVETVLDEKLAPGRYTVNWGGENFVSGLYFYTLDSGGQSVTKKLILLK